MKFKDFYLIEESILNNPNFIKWFGNSKAVTKNKTPLILYHGTGKQFSKFDPQKSGTRSKTPKGAFVFSSSSEMASSYTPRHTDFAGNVTYKDGANVKPVYLSIQKPLIVNANGDSWDDIYYKDEEYTTNELMQLAIDKGRDGLIIKNVFDSGEGLGIKGDVYVVFSPSQIKSAIGNVGEFSDTSDDINENQESKKRHTIYHGDNYGLSTINQNYKAMSLENSNQQEGAGIYFSTNIDTAKSYGSKIVKTTVDPNKFMDSRADIGKYLTEKDIANILKLLFQKNSESVFYFIYDYVEVTEESEVKPHHFVEVANILMTEQTRNFIITLDEISTTKDFVESFLKATNYKYFGTKAKTPNDQDKNEIYYVLIYNDDEVTPVNDERNK